MKVYIQSKSGGLNATTTFLENPHLSDILKQLRRLGGYSSFYRGGPVFVPFEEIQYIREANDND